MRLLLGTVLHPPPHGRRRVDRTHWANLLSSAHPSRTHTRLRCAHSLALTLTRRRPPRPGTSTQRPETTAYICTRCICTRPWRTAPKHIPTTVRAAHQTHHTGRNAPPTSHESPPERIYPSDVQHPAQPSARTHHHTMMLIYPVHLVHPHLESPDAALPPSLPP